MNKVMETKKVKILLYDKRENATSTMYVELLGNNKFRMIDNDLFNCRLKLGTEFETRINEEGIHEIIRITKESDYLTRRFFLAMDNRKVIYDSLHKELTERKGFIQVTKGGIAIINFPEEVEWDVFDVVEDLDFKFGLSEIFEDNV